MPQMAPLNWLLMFFIFVLTFMFFNILNYFSILYPPKSYITTKMSINLNWKW